MKKNVLCYGDSNTWGYVPGTFNFESGYRERFSIDQRWTKLLQKKLGEDFDIIEEGLGSRTTNINDPDKPGRNGVEFLRICLETHAPLHLVVLMLGTNDLNVKFNRNEDDIVKGLKELINCVQDSNCGSNMISPPKILVLSPPHLSHDKGFDGQFTGTIKISKKFPELYQRIADACKCYYLNVANQISVSDIDGIHLDANGHKELSEIIANKILEINLDSKKGMI